ncbi:MULTISPECIES: Holliday junction branch migration protein RuvA [Caproicibacterium]|jgi:Holliday junction DNA helicase RuvA|uniref:Holliday junction branch migration complex subunit RuvA n=1 Tax=Caproicibacterium lactatifermentans TaxID=2666138 RepID=A0A859DTY7_9FIRM|nr:Holliday junction branch migration protein RuvA [Caproicibacterium lactatifermentans]ARP49906.1 Holliday junction branch migration protein RuvA [Ruminococcaceae bacterium CPB6]MDD4807174.1 Holliday junction branch migration protein RuvA [Oscillospiraceae bacterium]QKN24372.1 Holliday junction branch migration protein RuvA [Caproicibacterium lactatifermentans]QKO30615.1 Holliday junction branch migration protein RuvA [Caproicibacterium lactatifermentans]
MFYSLKGTLTHIEPNIAVIECAGVGFLCRTTMNTQKALPQLGQEAKLYTHLNVREDALELFGFATKAELNCFKMLTTISGVGPKAGLSILSVLTPEQVAAAAATGDSKAFTRANGVGPKLGQRIVLEMKDKVKSMQAADPSLLQQPTGVLSAAGNAEAAVNALTVLGYSVSEANSAVAKLDSSLPVEELIRLALKSFGSAR